MNQGASETCVAYAFARVACMNLLHKYNVAINMEAIKEVANAGAQMHDGDNVFKGNGMMKFAEKWNPTICHEDICKEKRYKWKLDLKEITEFDAAFEKMRELQQAGLQMMIARRTGKKGHQQHAISAWRCDPIARTITATNSWGAHEPNMTVDAKNFICAVTVDPIITYAYKTTRGVTYAGDEYRTTDHYKSMPLLFARVNKLEADAGALPAEQDARRAAVDAQRAAEAQVQIERDRADAAELKVGRQATEIEALKKQVLPPCDPTPPFSAPLGGAPPPPSP